MIVTVKMFPMLRSAFCVAIVSICLVASQCTADNAPADQTPPATTTTTAANARAAAVVLPDDGHTPAVVDTGGVGTVGAPPAPANGDGDGTGTPGGVGTTPGASAGTSSGSTGSGTGGVAVSPPDDNTATAGNTPPNGNTSSAGNTATVGNTATGGNTASDGTPSGSGTTGTGSKITSTTTTKMVDDDTHKQNANETSTAPSTPLIKPTETVQRQQPVGKKNDGSSSTSLVLALTALVTLSAIAIAPV